MQSKHTFSYTQLAKAVFALFFFIHSSSLAFSQKAVKGVIDLSNVDLKNQKISLNGEWEFYWKELAHPSLIHQLEKDYYRYPKLWNGGTSVKGKELSSHGYATYRLKVALPPSSNTPDLAITINETYSSYRLFLDGFEISRNGTVGANKDEYVPDWLPETVTFARYKDTLTFVLQIANFDHYQGGSKEAIVIGDRKTMLEQEDFNTSYDFLLCGSLIMGGLFFLGLFLFGQHEQSVLYFALFCITFSYRMIGSGEYAFHALFRNMPWDALVRLEYISLFVPCGIFTMYSYSLYPQDGKKQILVGFSFVSALFTILSLITPPHFFTKLMMPYAVLISIVIFYMVYVYWLAYKRNRVGSQYALGSTGIVFIVAFYLISVSFTMMPENTLLSFFGFILFFFFQSLILSYRFAYSLKQATAAAEAASKAKSDFLSTISHEIRTPLNAVVGISHYLINEKPKKEQVESLESLQFSAEHLTSLISDILDYNKLEAGSIEFEYTDVNIKEQAEKIIKAHTALAREKGIDLIFEFDEKVHPWVEADPTRIYQVVNNLINNAIKFTHKGFVKLRVSLQSEEEDIQTVRCEVEDTGIGIPKDKQELVFERFTQAGSSTTREYGGTGLGLAIIKKILTLANSEILLESEVGKGTKFQFDIDFKKTKRKIEVNDGKAEEISDSIKGKRILLVEDNQMNVMVAKKFLKKWEIEVEVAQNGKIAVDMVSLNQYDLVLMDLQMPVMDGYDATKAIRNFNSSLPIVALTASALLKVREDVLNAGMNDYVTKPFDPQELKRKIALNMNKQ